MLLSNPGRVESRAAAVLFKRKPVQYVSKPDIENDDTEVWVIPQTGEIFVDYELYLNRMDFYKQRRFICQITGHSGLSFFEALKSELAGAQEVEEAFPEALKGPILRRIQFQTISRIDTLVDLIYDEYKSDYYPGEAVTVHVLTGERLTGVVRDKTRFGAKYMPDGTYSAPFSRYFVSLDGRPTEEAVVDDAHINRDRKVFTKQVLRSFIKKTVTREAWTGAPWLVKPEVAELYHIDTRVPPHLRYESKAAERKQNQAQKKSGPDYDGMVGSFQGNTQPKLPELRPSPKSHKSKQHQQAQAQTGKSKKKPALNPAPSNPNALRFVNGLPLSNDSDTDPTIFEIDGVRYRNSNLEYQPYNQGALLPPFPFVNAPTAPPLPPPPPPPIKYPIEDLQLSPKPGPPKRPQLKYFSQDVPDEKAKVTDGKGILMKSVGPLLEVWDTLNVYCEVFKLDSFTFDDFVEALQFSAEDVDCELFVEIHCAALKLLVNSEAEGGKVQVQLPEIDEESDEEESEEETAAPTPTPEPEPPRGRATRSSLAKAEAEALRQASEAKRSPTPEPTVNHQAAEMSSSIDWIEKLRKRDFKNGGWQITIAGLLHQLSKDPRYFKPCEELLEQLAPLELEPTQETARQQYAKLDINLRVQALQIVCMLTAETKAIRGYMEECSEQMTSFRKEKIQWQRDRKTALEELRLLNEERKILLPANLPPDPEPEPEQKDTNGDVKMHDTEESVEEAEEEVPDTDEEPRLGRSLRRGHDRAAERQRKREAEQVKKLKAEAAAKMPKQSRQFIKLEKDIKRKLDFIKKCEEEIAVIDNDLREADCPRTRVLGKDRFWNRYYWFERNGMPFGGLPTSSTAEAEYANGCIWVQGPDDMEREGYIDMKPEWQNEYKAQFNMTVPERKKMEEGETNVFNAHQWGYFDEPEAVNALIDWLDPRGFNELKLKKELQAYRDKIVRHMEKRKEYLNAPEEREKSVDSGPAKRMSTRTKHHPLPNPEHTAHRCLSWHNNIAVEELGHLHSEQPRSRKPAKKAAAAAAEERETR
ncbi:hypothetical protein B7463_g6624, partial [Scytalidium lignicola]